MRRAGDDKMNNFNLNCCGAGRCGMYISGHNKKKKLHKIMLNLK